MCKLIALWVCLAAGLVAETTATYGDCPVDYPYRKIVQYKNRSPFQVSMDPAPEGGEDPNTLFKGSGVTLISSGPVTITITVEGGLGFWPQALRMEVKNAKEWDIHYTLQNGTVITKRVKTLGNTYKIRDEIEKETGQKVTGIVAKAVPKKGFNLEMSDLRMVVCLRALDIGMCPADAPKKRRVTYRKQDDFTFVASPGGDARNALQKSGQSMKSTIPVKITIERGGLEFLILELRIKVRNAASVIARIYPDENPNNMEIKKRGRVYSWTFVHELMYLRMVPHLELTLTPKAGKIMEFKDLVLEACKA